jgi:NAD(P)-dependent dehydrogenase (short-subunit alcohol dehydrogenase family)
MSGLDGTVVLITGASRGVGLATALRLGRLSAAVALLATDRGRLATARQQVDAAGARAIELVADVSDVAAMREAVERVEAELGGLDVLVNNAGIGRYGPVGSFGVEEWRRVIETNLTGVFVATQAALPAIRRRGGGHVIAISSGAGKRGYPNMSAYCASKFGLHGFMEALAAELADERIKCTTVVPGGILTDFGVRTREQRLASGDRFLEPDDVAGAIEFVLLQPERSWTQELNVWPR